MSTPARILMVEGVTASSLTSVGTLAVLTVTQQLLVHLVRQLAMQVQ